MNIVERQIRRCNRNLVLVNSGMIAFLIVFLISNQRYLYNCIAGPFPISAGGLHDLTILDNHKYLSLQQKLESFDTGTYVKHTRNGVETSRDSFLGAKIDDRVLLIKSSSKHSETYYSGELTAIPSDVRDIIAADLRKEGMDFDALFLPLMLDSTSYRSDAYIWVGIGLPVFGLCLFNLRKALSRIEDAKSHPTYWGVNRYGDPEEVAKLIDAEASSQDIQKYGKFLLTPSWILHKTFFSFTPFHLSDIVWIYAKKTQHSINLIPTGKSHSAVIRDAAGRTAETNLGRGSEKTVEKFIETVRERIPWVVAGYSDEIKSLYEKKLSEFVATVAERRQEYESTNAE